MFAQEILKQVQDNEDLLHAMTKDSNTFKAGSLPAFFMGENLEHLHSIILFDGVCNLCNKSVQFIIKRDKKDHFRFASLQSEVGQQFALHYQLSTADLSSFILIENNKAYTRSTGALRVARKLSGGWPLLYIFIIIPSFIRNIVYNIVASNRYRWFGKQEACWLPSPRTQNKFL